MKKYLIVSIIIFCSINLVAANPQNESEAKLTMEKMNEQFLNQKAQCKQDAGCVKRVTDSYTSDVRSFCSSVGHLPGWENDRVCRMKVNNSLERLQQLKIKIKIEGGVDL